MACYASANSLPQDTRGQAEAPPSPQQLQQQKNELQGLILSIPYKKLALWGLVFAAAYQLHEFFGVSKVHSQHAVSVDNGRGERRHGCTCSAAAHIVNNLVGDVLGWGGYHQLAAAPCSTLLKEKPHLAP